VKDACGRFVLLCLLLGLVQAGSAREKVMGMSKQTYDAINVVQLLLDEEQWAQSVEKLDKLLQRKLNNYERAHVLNMKGFSLYQLDDMQHALATYEMALVLEDLPDSQVRALLTTVSQLALVVEDYPAAERFALRLISSPGKNPPQAMSHVILAQAYIGQEQYAKAEAPLLKAISMQREKGSLPRENWMSMLSAVYFNLDDYVSMRDVLYELVELYPRERYLINLAALHGQLGETDKQLALVESLLDDQRLQREHHLLNLANLFLAHKMPYKAAALLETEMDAERIESTRQNLELQSQAWYLAGEEERAIPPLAAAAAIAEDGELYIRVARLYMDIYDWKNAEIAAKAAAEKGGLRNPGGAWLLQGMALARTDELGRARKAFRRALKYEDNRKWAEQWLKFVDNEERRLAMFAQ
jgi:tetratricopeptide (TPR) repeat protein